MSENRITVPLRCEACGGPLNRNEQICDYCGTPWEYVERYRGPSIPDGLLHYSQSISCPSTAVATIHPSSCVVYGTFGIGGDSGYSISGDDYDS